MENAVGTSAKPKGNFDVDSGSGVADSGVKYPHNILEGFGNGCLMDLRVRIALDLLKAPLFANMLADGLPNVGKVDAGQDNGVADPSDIAGFALDLAAELMWDAERRGWVDTLPDDDGLNRQVRLQAARTARYQVWQQLAGTRQMQDEQNRVSPVAPVFGGTMGRNQ